MVSSPGSPVDVRPLDVGDRTAEPLPRTVAPIELPKRTVDLSGIATQVREAATEIATFADMVIAESARADEFRLRLATSLSAGITDDRRQALVSSVTDEIDDAFSKVSLTGQTSLNLTSRSGSLPLTVTNANPFPVRVVLRIASDRLRFPDGDTFELDLTDETTRVDVRVTAQATGSVPTTVTLTTPDGSRILDEHRLDVRSTAISGVGLALSLGALAVLVFWWARTWRRNRRDGAGGRGSRRGRRGRGGRTRGARNAPGADEVG